MKYFEDHVFDLLHSAKVLAVVGSLVWLGYTVLHLATVLRPYIVAYITAHHLESVWDAALQVLWAYMTCRLLHSLASRKKD